MKTKIRLKNIIFYGRHGVDEKEKNKDQEFQIDIEICKKLDVAIDSDDIHLTTDYNVIYNRVEETFLSNRYSLIEALAGKIASTLVEDCKLLSCKVVIRKPDAPIKGILDTVEVEVIQDA